MMTNVTQSNIDKKVGGKILSGTVVSDKMKDTVVVEVIRFVKVTKYEKYVKRNKRYQAHDAGNTKKIGDKVQIQECKPISKNKHFRVLTNESSIKI